MNRRGNVASRFLILIALSQAIGCGEHYEPAGPADVVCSGNAVRLGAGCATLTVTALPSLTPTETRTNTASPAPTLTLTAVATQTTTATPSSTRSAPPTASLTPSASPTQTATASPADGLCGAGEISVGAVCTSAGAEAGFRLDIEQPQNPFPDDRYRATDGSFSPPAWSFLEFADPSALDPDQSGSFGVSLLAQIRANATGWGVFSPLELQLSGAIDTASLPQGLIVLRHLPTGWSVQEHGFSTVWHAPIHTLDVQPLMPFDAAQSYAVVLTSAVKTANGAPLGRSSDFRAVLRGDAGAELQPVLDYVSGTLGIARDEVALAFTFTTQETWQDLLSIRDRLDSGDLPAPTISFEDIAASRYTEGVFTDGPMKDQLLSGHGDAFQIAAVGSAQLYDFRGHDSVFDRAVLDGSTAPKTVRVRVEIAVPDQPMPEGGFPVVILGHGLGGSADFAWEIAAASAEIGMVPPFIMIAADFPNHGARGTGNQLGDTIRYFHLDNFYAMRDSFRQTAAELLEVRRLVETATGLPFDLINKNKILFAGASLGGINGATFLGVDSRVHTALLSVPAGELVRILEGAQIGNLVAPVIASFVGIKPSDPAYADFFRMMINRGLWIMGPGDPISYAPFIVGEQQLPGATRKAVLIQEGINDGVLPNVTTEDLARVMGVPIIDSGISCDTPGCSVSGMWQYNLADYGLPGEEPHLVSAKVREAQEQLLTYLASDGQVITDASPQH